MADCATSIQQFKAVYDRLNSLTSRYRTIRNTINIVSQTDTAKITSGINQLISIISEINNLKDRNREIYRAANWDSDQCPDGQSLSSGLDNDIPERIDEVNNIINTAQYRVDQLNAENAKKQAEATQKATTTQNNAGNGTPGSAGTASNADQLTGVTVTGQKKPTTPQGVGASGAPTTPGATGLEEVSVTGKRSPEKIDPASDPGAKDGLDGVTVTGKRATDPGATGNNNTVPGIKKAQSQAVLKDTTNFEAKKDWRVRLSLSPGANYLYKAQNPGILAPLLVTDGVLFPYTPSIQVNYTASYDGTQLTHSNYKFFQYTSSNVDSVNLTCDFTAQDTYEANYLLAVIHFFRSATKMFYGQDENPKPGTPPPLCYLFGLGEYQFNAHPLAITNFSYSLPNNVDYIRANLNESGSSNFSPTARRSNAPTKAPEKPKILDAVLGALQQTRLAQGLVKPLNSLNINLVPGGGLANPDFQNNKGFNSIVPPGTNEPTYVPTSIQLSISCVPIVSRYDISNTFSLRDYATGELLRGVKRSGGGIW